MEHLLRQTYNLYRDSYSGHRKEIWALAILTFINRLGTMVLPFLTVYLTTILGFSLKEAGNPGWCFRIWLARRILFGWQDD